MKVLNDLYDYGLKIFQDNDYFKFSLDSILLAEYINNIKKSDIILDLCTGNAAIPMILSTYYKNKIIGFEVQKSVSDLADSSILYNNLNNQITIINDDVKNINNYFPGNSFDVVLANPPYFKINTSSLTNNIKEKAIARHEMYLNLEDLFKITSLMLKDKGIFYLVHLPSRLEEILHLCETYKIIAKEIQFVYTKKANDASILLLKCVKNANNSVKIKSPVFISDYSSFKNIFRRID